MPLFRRLGPYFACLVAGLGTGVGFAYLLYIRLNRELTEIRKLIHDLRRELDLYSNNTQRKKNRPTITGQYSITASSGDDDEDFVDCVAGLSDRSFDNESEPALVKFVRSPQTRIECGAQLSKAQAPEEQNGDATPALPPLSGDQLSPVKEVSDVGEDVLSFVPGQENEDQEEVEEEAEEAGPRSELLE